MAKSASRTLKTLGWKIQKLRKMHGMTQEEFAGHLGISRVYMGYLEQGRSSPSLKLLMKISRKFKVPLTQLFVYGLPQ